MVILIGEIVIFSLNLIAAVFLIFGTAKVNTLVGGNGANNEFNPF
jgi:hypothetical protein